MAEVEAKMQMQPVIARKKPENNKTKRKVNNSLKQRRRIKEREREEGKRTEEQMGMSIRRQGDIHFSIFSKEYVMGM